MPSSAPEPHPPGASAAAIGPLGDVPPEAMRALLHRMADWVADYREGLEGRSIAPATRPGEVAARFGEAPPEQGIALEELLAQLDQHVMPGILHWGHPAFLGYFGSTSNGPALLGEIVAAALNVSAMTWRTSPAAVELEAVVLGWLRQMVGLPAEYTGLVYDTASVALLHALAAAREAAGPDIRAQGLLGRPDLPALRVYASDQAHSSAQKAMVVLGLGEANLVRLPCDDGFRLDPLRLEAAIASDLAAGHRPLAVIATVGTTSTAAVDPVPAIAAACGRHGLWLHVDAAYGGAMGLLPEGRPLLDGVDRADSVVVNPHKWLLVPLDFSALFVRRPERLRAVFGLTPEYLRGDASAGAAAAMPDPMDHSLALGRRFRALKAWLALAAFGRAGLESRIREHLRLAALWARWVEAEPGFRLSAPPSMAIVCFRFEAGDDPEAGDRLNGDIVEAVNASGEAYLTHTRLRGRVAMRVGIGNILTTEAHLGTAWARVRREARRAITPTPPP